MDKIFKLLKKSRLDKYLKKFIDLGIKEEQDFIDSVDDVTLKNMGMSCNICKSLLKKCVW